MLRSLVGSEMCIRDRGVDSSPHLCGALLRWPAVHRRSAPAFIRAVDRISTSDTQSAVRLAIATLHPSSTSDGSSHFARRNQRTPTMSDHHQTGPRALPPHAQLIQMGIASWVSAVLYAAAKLGLADQLATEPKNAAELATAMQLHAPSLHRLMRTLASLGVLTERDAQRFALTPLGEALQTGAPGSARATLIAFGGTFWHGWEEILYSLETGRTGFDKAHGMPLFEYLSQHPADASYFNEAMVGFHGDEPAAVARAYDFSAFKTVVDVGGAVSYTHLRAHETPEQLVCRLLL